MNRTAIEWTDYTWNPITGCRHGCPYCYGQKIAQRFPGNFPNGFAPTFHPERLREPYNLKTPSKIFVVSMGDLFGRWVPESWQNAVFKVVEDNPRHIFQFLTKDPVSMLGALEYQWLNDEIPQNMWIGHSFTGTKIPFPTDCLDDYRDYAVKFVSFEPLLDSISKGFPFGHYDWIIIGAQTNPRKNPDPKWVQSIIDRARDSGCKIFLKDTIQEWWPERLREFPEVKP